MSKTLRNQLNRAMGEDEQDDALADDRPLIDQFMDYGSHTMFDGPVSQDQDGKAWAVKDGGLVLDILRSGAFRREWETVINYDPKDAAQAVTGDGEPVKRGTLTPVSMRADLGSMPDIPEYSKGDVITITQLDGTTIKTRVMSYTERCWPTLGFDVKLEEIDE